MADKKISALTSATTPLAGTEVLPIVQSGSTVKVEVNDMLETISVTSPAVNSEGNIFLRATDSLGAGVGTQIGLGGKYNASSYFPFGGISARKENNTNNNVAGYTDILTTTSGGTLTARMRFNSTGDGTLLNGNFVVGTAGKGIDFSANTHAAGMTSELLTWYEEGNVTLTLTDGTATVSLGTCKYIRVGKQVTVYIVAYNKSMSGLNTAANLTITGLPFAAGADASSSWVPSLFVAGTSFATYIANGSSTITLYRTSNSVDYNGVPLAAFSSPANMSFFMTVSYLA